jgi:hypothetical protein
MMKSRICSYSIFDRRLYSSTAAGSWLRVGSRRDQAHHPRLDQVDAGRLQRLHEAAGQAQGHDVLVPGLLARPVVNRSSRGSARGAPSRFAIRVAAASSSLMNGLE